ILVILIVSLFLSKEILDPIENLSSATKRVAEGDLNFQVHQTFNDEFMTLSKSFNLMINELELSRNKLKQKEKIETWQEIARQLAHEIKNPLTPIKLSVERLLKKYNEKSEDFSETIDKCSKTILREVGNIDRLLNEFANFSKFIALEKSNGEINHIIFDVVEEYRHNEKNIAINFIPISSEYQILRDEIQIKKAFSYIIKDFIENSKENSNIEIFVDHKNIGYNKYLIIVVKNKNIIECDEFVPSFGTNKSDKTLSLLIAEKIITEHDGRVYSTIKNDIKSMFIELPIFDNYTDEK
ncbi:MAG TPA: HAMP domain-containing protein, partial [Spirochaetota bacterium]|nr:HAMP domain-containing protein [Spirochaetota bacterium]